MEHLYFIGICGTAMGNAALMMRALGHTVSGSDANIYPPMSDLLQNEGITLFEGFDASHLSPPPDLVVIGNAMSRGNAEVETVLNNRVPFISLPELLKKYIIQGRESIVISGTHGKTTTTSLAAHTFASAGLEPNFLIGGVAENFGRGYDVHPHSKYVILEGDEYDSAFFDKRSKFLHYLPTTLIINNIEFDHADIFASLDDILLAFKRASLLVPSNGIIIANGDDSNVKTVLENAPAPVITFGLGSENTWRAEAIRQESSMTSFELWKDSEMIAVIRLPLLGEFNVRNALAVIAASVHYGISLAQIQTAFETFRSVKRRLEHIETIGGIDLYDDFAHHPTAIAATLRAVRSMYPDRRIITAFEPRSNTTRRNIFQRELAECFNDADVVYISQIARLHLLSEKKRLDPEQLVGDIRAKQKEAFYLEDAETISSHIALNIRSGDVVVILSNGSFGGMKNLLVTKITKAVSTQK
jgi:UDP-N-acetylmuramate: L-alanyl-gamma-D-glutamyl-meso-diaminopimelate ligase